MSIFCFMCDMQINYKMGKYGVYNLCKIGQIYRLSNQKDWNTPGA